MAQKKLERFAAIKKFKNVLEYPIDMQGKWGEFFGNKNPIIVELACGKGEYTVGLAQMYPYKNVIGVDIKGNRLFVGAKKCITENLQNAAFLRTQIEQLNNYFTAGELSEIWITFPDPQLRSSKAKKRLTHPRFLQIYHRILKPGGKIHLKTDSPVLFNFTKKIAALYGLTIFEQSENIFAQEKTSEELKIKTHYEGLDIAQSNAIFYLQFMLPPEMKSFDTELQQIIDEERAAC